MTIQPIASVCPLSAPFLWNLLNSSPEPMVIKDRSHRWIAFNEAFCHWVGRDRSQLVNGADTSVFSAQTAQQCWVEDEQLFTTGLAQSVERSLSLVQGHSVLVFLQRFLFHGEDGLPYVVNGFRPVSTQSSTEIEAALRASYATSRALVEAIPDLLIRMHADGTLLDLAFEGDNKPTAIAAVPGKTIFDFMPFKLAERRVFHAQKALETNQLQIYEQEVFIEERRVYEEVRIIPSGESEVLVMVRDVTDRKRAEIELQQLNEQLETQVEARTAVLKKVVSQLETEIHERKLAKAQLQEKEEFLRSIYDGIEHQVFVVDVVSPEKFCMGGWNRVSEVVLGIASEASIGKTPFEVFEPEDAQTVLQNYRRCLETGAAITYEECLMMNHEPVWWMTTLNPQKDATGQVRRLIGTAIDISDRKRAELALQQSETQLRQQTEELKHTLQELQQTQMQLVQSEKMSGLGQLVAGVAHEINNPVNFIYGNLSHANDYTQDLLNLINLYQAHYPTPVPVICQEIEAIELDFLMEDLPKLLQSMKVGAERIQKIVSSLRTFSRMDEAEMKSVSLQECLDSTLMILQNRIKAKSDRAKIEVIKQYADLPHIECYAGQLNQVFMNILSNAIDAVEARLEQEHQQSATATSLFLPQITVRLHQPNSTLVQIAIADNGSGIPENVQARIFDPFFTTKPIGKGTGMGLSISYQIITEKHRGSLSCDSSPNHGTEFVIEIPVQQMNR